MKDCAAKKQPAKETKRSSRIPSAISTAARRYDLTPREIECLTLLALGHSQKLIAAKLARTGHAAHFHLKNIYFKLSVNSATQAIAKIFF